MIYLVIHEVWLLPKILLKTYEHYSDLLNVARALLHNEEGRLLWKGGWCKVVVKYHSQKLHTICSLAPCYIDHIIKSYVFLRDASEKDFRHQSMFDTLWDQVNEPSHSSSTTPTLGNPCCSHCHVRGIHGGGWAKCPGGSLTQAMARKTLRGAKKEHTLTKLWEMCKEVSTKIQGVEPDSIDGIVDGIRAQYGLS